MRAIRPCLGELAAPSDEPPLCVQRNGKTLSHFRVGAVEVGFERRSGD